MLYQIVSMCVEVHLLQHSRLFTPLNGQLLHPSFIYAAGQLYKTQTVWTPGGPNSSSVFPRIKHRRSSGIVLGWEEAFYKVTPRAHSNTVVTPHPHPALLTCSVYDPKQSPRHPTPPSSSTGQHAYGIFMNVTSRSTARLARSWCFKSM